MEFIVLGPLAVTHAGMSVLWWWSLMSR